MMLTMSYLMNLHATYACLKFRLRKYLVFFLGNVKHAQKLHVQMKLVYILSKMQKWLQIVLNADKKRCVLNLLIKALIR